MDTRIVLTGIGLCLVAGVWSYAYRLGMRHGRSTSVPFRLIDELLDHKIHCRTQDPATARIELENTLGIEAWESQSLLQQVVLSSRAIHRKGIEGDSPTVNRTKEVV